MRTPRLVVKYVEGPRLGSDLAEYAGVFITGEEVDGIFAASEPPAHDDWVADQLDERRHKTFVRVAHRNIRRAIEDFAEPAPPARPPGDRVSLGALSERLGTLLPGTRSTGARASDGRPPRSGEKPGPRRPGRRAPHARVVLDQEPTLTTLLGKPVIEIRFQVEHAEGSNGTRISLRAGALLEGVQLESDPPRGATIPSILEWKSDTGERLSNRQEIEVDRSMGTTWTALVRPVFDAQTGLQLDADSF